jgi:hypothetical protein
VEPKKLEEGRFEKEERMKIPDMVELSEQLPPELILQQPYDGAKYLIAKPVDFAQGQVPIGGRKAFIRFVGRKIRRYFDSLNLSSRADMTAHEGRVVKYDSVSRLFSVKYSDGFRGGDEEDLDLDTLEGVLVMRKKYGDKREDWRNRVSSLPTRKETCR